MLWTRDTFEKDPRLAETEILALPTIPIEGICGNILYGLMLCPLFGTQPYRAAMRLLFVRTRLQKVWQRRDVLNYEYFSQVRQTILLLTGTELFAATFIIFYFGI